MEKENPNGREILRGASNFDASQKSLNSDFEKNPSTISEMERGESADLLARVKSASFEDEETVRLWLLQKSKHTARAYERVAIEALDFLNSLGRSFESAKAEDLINFCNLKPGSAKATIIQRAAIVKSVFSFGVRSGRLKFNPSLILKFKRSGHKISDKILTVDEVLSMIESVKSPRDEAILRMLYSSAGRRSEIINLNWGHVFERGDGSAKISIFGKGDKRREIVISAKTYAAIKNLKSENTKSSDPVFTCEYGKKVRRISETTIYLVVKRAALLAGIRKQVSPHFLRHSHATHALKGGASLKLLQDTLGHASIEMTGRYLHSDPEESSGKFLGI